MTDEITWTWLMTKTEPYCEYRAFYCEQIATEIKGWWMSREALDDVMRYEWPN